MKEKLLRHPIVEGILYLLCWGVFAVLTGTIGGFLGGLFARAIRLVTGLRAVSPWVMAALPLCGLAIVWLYQVTGEEKNRGVNMVLASISAGDRVTMATGPLIFVSSILSHLGGASVGREGASLQLGGWLGARLAELTGLDEKNKRVGIIATRASIRSGAYEAALHRLDREAAVVGRSCPLFVPLVENGRFRRGDVVIETVAREYLAPLKEEGVDTLILGCTHYPLLEGVIADVMGPEVTLVSAGEESAFELKRLLKADGRLADESRRGHTEFYVSDQAEEFEQAASIFLQEDVRHTARRIDIERC